PFSTSQLGRKKFMRIIWSVLAINGLENRNDLQGTKVRAGTIIRTLKLAGTIFGRAMTKLGQ
ncbi:1583_t:CDS:2, partial [Funneliformis mosseae]